jgi:hypothetical protein
MYWGYVIFLIPALHDLCKYFSGSSNEELEANSYCHAKSLQKLKVFMGKTVVPEQLQSF